MQKGMSICTKTGDDGSTGLIGGKRLPKDHPLIECLGTIDELNAFLGDAKTAAHESTAQIITAIQNELFTLSGVLAGSKAQIPGEKWLNALIAELEETQSAETPPPPATFAVPGANPLSAKLHIARTVCRRAERRLVSLGSLNIIPPDEYRSILAWLNRLSDVLFLLAQQEAAQQEAAW
ncbi:MAG: cob(I)yrinic acid a,c-diamide adenosyltransferase [Treponema sp.]|jgi:cob(I)alamin adenosyltransferase|nr:cob(I)yrinic acid a,c-diamide adenosyltransferase [Treponema sp.]